VFWGGVVSRGATRSWKGFLRISPGLDGGSVR
jgi:hypothetical protein